MHAKLLCNGWVGEIWLVDWLVGWLGGLVGWLVVLLGGLVGSGWMVGCVEAT